MDLFPTAGNCRRSGDFEGKAFCIECERLKWKKLFLLFPESFVNGKPYECKDFCRVAGQEKN
jgi:hypothetical protein